MGAGDFHSDNLELRIAQRLCRLTMRRTLDALLVCSATAVTGWQRLGEIELLIPSLARYQARDVISTPLVIDESCLHNGPWSGIAGSTGERNLAELEEVAHGVRGFGGLVIGVGRKDEVPDVNLRRVRELYDLRVNFSRERTQRRQPRIVQSITAALSRFPEEVHE